MLIRVRDCEPITTAAWALWVKADYLSIGLIQQESVRTWRSDLTFFADLPLNP